MRIEKQAIVETRTLDYYFTCAPQLLVQMTVENTPVVNSAHPSRNYD